MRHALLFLCLTVSASAQNFFILDWAEGDLTGDGVPERVYLVSSQSSDPAHPSSKKQLLVMEYHKQAYRQVFQKSVQAPFFCKSDMQRLNSAYADVWGLQFLPPNEGQPARFKVTFTPGSGEFFTLLHDGQRYRTESSGD